MRLRSVFTCFALLGVGLSLVFASVATPKATPLIAASFQSNGDVNNGWTWIRSSGQSATYSFTVAGLQAVKGSSLYLNLTGLVTNGAGGGSGYSTLVKFTVSNGTKTGVIGVQLTNPFRPIDPQNSGGLGYQAYGNAVVSSTYWKGAQTLTLTYTYPPNPHAPTSAPLYHVALNQSGMTLAYSSPAV